MKLLRGTAIALVLLLTVHVVSPAGTVTGPTVAHAEQANGPNPWWWGPVVWLVTECITSWGTGSWYERNVCRRASRMVTWLIDQMGDVMCLGKFEDAISDPNQEHRQSLYKCILREGLPAIR